MLGKGLEILDSESCLGVGLLSASIFLLLVVVPLHAEDPLGVGVVRRLALAPGVVLGFGDFVGSEDVPLHHRELGPAIWVQDGLVLHGELDEIVLRLEIVDAIGRVHQ